MIANSRWQWLDFDETESKQVRDFLSQDVDGEGVDPLRIGASVRDRIADQLFPGTSTQYTRLRYLFLTAAILRKKGATIGRLPQSQTTLNIALYKANPKETGVIGRRTPERDFVHLYWGALRTWKLLTPLTADVRDVTVANGLSALQSKSATDEEGNPLLEHRVQWNKAVVMLADKFWDGQKAKDWPCILCSQAEVDFILGQWLALPDKPPLAAIAAQLRERRKVSKATSHGMVSRAIFPWEVDVGSFNGARAQLDRAKAVSLICWSAQLAYNFAILKAAKKLEDEGRETAWQQRSQDLEATKTQIARRFDEWKEAFKAEKSTLGPWAQVAHWENLGSDTSRSFLARTADMLFAGKTNLKSDQWSDWVKAREKVNPAPKLSNDKNLAAWSGTPEMAKRWDFRWSACVQRFVKDAENPRG